MDCFTVQPPFAYPHRLTPPPDNRQQSRQQAGLHKTPKAEDRRRAEDRWAPPAGAQYTTVGGLWALCSSWLLRHYWAQLLSAATAGSTALYCTALYRIGLYRTALHCTALHCTALHCTALHCTALHCTALHCTALHCTALHCTVLIQCTDPLCTTLHSLHSQDSPTTGVSLVYTLQGEVGVKFTSI